MNEYPPKHLAALGWPWKSEDHALAIILTSDEQFVGLASDPDKPVENLYPGQLEPISLREYCRQGAASGASKVHLAYDYFFGGHKRSLYPDSEVFQETLKKIHDLLTEFGLSLEPSILSPLELGVGYHEKTGESGRWMHYREGLRDPETGLYSVTLWQHTRWCNNKGPTPIRLIGVRAFAFREQRIPDTPFFAVDPNEIIELAQPSIEELGATYYAGTPGVSAEERSQFEAVRVRVWGKGDNHLGPLDRVLVVLLYRTVEMDYFSPSAPGFLNDLVEQIHHRGISIVGLYADEMHIQQDWSYHSHFDNGQFTLRYVSAEFERAFAERFGAQYRDFAKYLVYFACNQHDFLSTHEPKLGNQHVFGPALQDVKETLLFRRNYYHFLESTVVNLMNEARKKWEGLVGKSLDAYYHATWAESPTVDAWRIGDTHQSWSALEHSRKYDYSPDFLWSNTVHQAASACANYFLWNDFLTGGNNDTAEGGYSDRDYYGRALACSLAALNRRPLAWAASWGMPNPVRERMEAVSAVFGAGGHAIFRSVQDYAPRQIEVLFLYPQDLVAIDERFGSWMVQYGYANFITAEQLVARGQVSGDGWLIVNQARYRTICALYEPFPDSKLFQLLQTFVAGGGSLVWSGVPPLLALDGSAGHQQWVADLFGVQLAQTADPLGLPFPARRVVFEGALADVTPMTILTDFTIDRVFPAHSLAGTETVAAIRAGGASSRLCVGTRKQHPGGGQAVYLGFRPRDDQAASTGEEVRSWFEILDALGAYPASGVFKGNDHPSVVSRTTDYLAATFPNGAVAICPHYRHHEESWPGGFFRDEARDQQALQDNPVPDDQIILENIQLAGYAVSFRGRHAAAWRCNAAGDLAAFAGLGCTGIRLNDRVFTWADQAVDIAWHPLPPEHHLPDCKALYRVWCGSADRIRVPLALSTQQNVQVWVGAHIPMAGSRRREEYSRVGYGSRTIPFSIADGQLEIDVDEAAREHWLYVTQT